MYIFNIKSYFSFQFFIHCYRWIEQTVELGKIYDWVQIFENKGAIMGCSNPHPHCQIWASSFTPNEPRIKDIHQLEYYEKHGRPLLLDYANAEIKKQVNII
jgi:UDPglucose--hexose-1-phosphate uridylyltransferase